MSQVEEALGEIAKFGRQQARVVLKSTVPVGSAIWARQTLAALERPDLRVLSNPEFLAEGAAVRGFLEPDRVVIGARSAEDAAPLLALYRTVVPDHTPVLIMDHASAELAKYAANAMLATRVSLMNELAGLCEVSGADIERVREVVGADVRIGDRYLRAGAGFGGSCFPKDLLALEAIGANAGRPTAIVRAVRLVNERQRLRVYEHLLALLGRADAGGLRVAVWGLAFKPETDDLRESPAVTVIERLVADGAQVVAWDAVAIPAAKAQLDASVVYADDPVQAAEGADAVLLMTEWPELRAVDLVGLAQRMRQRIIVDGRNVFDPAVMDAAGFSWASIGRKPRHATLGREGI
jgi:UDPglucose 6-dehydrogenase